MEDGSVSMGAPAEGAGSATPPESGAVGRIVGVFVKPRKTFESMRERPRFLLAAVLVVLAQLVIAGVMVRSDIPRDEAIAKMERQGDDPAKIEAVTRFFDSPAAPIVTMVTAVVGTGFALIVSAALLFFMGNLMLGGRITFRHYMSATAFGAIVGLVDNAVRIGLILAKQGYDVRLGLGNAFGEEIGFAGRFLDSLTDPLALWATAITALAVSVYAKKGFGFGVAAALPGFVILALLQGFGH